MAEIQGEKDKAQTYIRKMERNVSTIENCIEDLVTPVAAPRKQFYQKRLIKAVGKIEKLLSELHTGTKTEAK